MIKKILMLNCEFPPIGGGAANMNWYFLKEVANRGDIEIDLVTSGFNHSSINHDFGSNIRVWKINIWKKSLHHWTLREMFTYLWRGYFIARKLISEHEYDIVHAIFGFPSGLIAYLFRKKVPYVVSMRGSDVPFFNSRFSIWYKIMNPLIKMIWKSAIGLSSNSESLKELALETKPDIEIKVIPNGVDPNEFSPDVSARGSGLRILTVARLIERKGIGYLIDAVSKMKMRMPGLSLTVVGSGYMKSKLEQQAKEKMNSDSIRFLGEVPHNELPAIYSSHDIFVLPSFNEGMSNALLEAMASGLPIITTITGGTKELMNGNAVLIEKGSSESIIEALDSIIDDAEKLERMKRISVERSKKFSWSKTTQEYIDFYNDSLAGN